MGINNQLQDSATFISSETATVLRVFWSED